jgi:hypothetical protein
MSPIRISLVTTALLTLLGACTDPPTAPGRDFAPRALVGISVVPDPTLVTFNSASCSLASALIGTANCSWNISNPDANTLNLAAEIDLTATYNCVNPHNSRIASAEQRELSTLIQQFSVSATTLLGSNVPIPPPFLPVNNTGKFKKENACKGNQIVQGLSYQISYWRISVITVGGVQRVGCFASDNREGCFTS